MSEDRETADGERRLLGIARRSLRNTLHVMNGFDARIDAIKSIKGKQNRKVAKARLLAEWDQLKHRRGVLERLESRECDR